jgi:3'-phosphoadenosine 5'-phosphosulfate sulfotransferase (PAPS reductase)/FAD synthetase
METLFKQISLFEEVQKEVIEYKPLEGNIYGRGKKIFPHIPSKPGNKYLDHICPLEWYDYICIGTSGGKDCIAALLYLLELGVPKEKIILLHHCIDGKGENPILNMDWSFAESYCLRIAEALGVKIKFSWRELGFAGEIFREGASRPIFFEELESDEVIETRGANWTKTEEIKAEIEKKAAVGEDTTELETELRSLGFRYKFPSRTASLSTRWCSSALKIEIADRIFRYSRTTHSNSKILFVDGIRREESSNRSRYNECELHSCNAPTKKRYIHHWRPIIEWTEEMVWDIFKKYGVRPSPSYYCGFNRMSCALCIFSMPQHFKGVKELMPERFDKLVEVEKELGFTVVHKMDLNTYIGQAESCVPKDLEKSTLDIIRTGIVPKDYVLLKEGEEWKLPSGAYKGCEGGSN